MDVQKIVKKLQCEILVEADSQREITSFYIGDFLSNVMSKASVGTCWLTVMTNVNVAGVAVLTECACVIVCEGHEPDDNLVARCKEQGVNLLTCKLPLYDAAIETL